jgi:predicted acylesterase/phospholipase RssA
MSTEDKRDGKGTRKLLALDGGGIRGMITLEVLAKIEGELQNKLGRDDKFVLANYFDYIAGTSTGAIIATCLSLGMRVDEIRDFYIDSGPAMFDKTNLIRRYVHNKFHDRKLAGKLQDVIAKKTGEPQATLGCEALQTYLLLILRNASTDSPWPISNNPAAKYNARTRDVSNLELPLWQLVRASTAAPTYFPPEVITIRDHQNNEHDFVFVDGGVTMYNNPAFQLFLMATVAPYNLRWPAGEDRMLVVSVGTGSAARANEHLSPDEMNIIYNAGSIPSALMYAASNEQDFLCRTFGKCLSGGVIDSEVGDMKGSGGEGPVVPKLFTYVRYNADLSRDGLNRLGLPHIVPRNVQQLDSVDHISELREVGGAVAKEVDISHFAGFLEASVGRH